MATFWKSLFLLLIFYEWLHLLIIVINIDLIFYLLNTALYNHIYSPVFFFIWRTFFLSKQTKIQILRCLKVYSYFHLRFFWLLFIDVALSDFCTFEKLSPSVCIFNLTSASGKISVIICLQVNNFFHFLGNLNYYHLPGKYLFPLPGVLFPLLGNLNCYLLPGKYHFPLPGNSFPLPGKSQLLPSTR